MKVFDKPPGLYDFKYLPAYTKFIYDHHYIPFIERQIDLAKEFEVPIMKYLNHLSREQLIEMSKVSTKEWMDYLIENRAKEQIVDSMEKWVGDQLEIIGKFELVAEDITSINHIRSKGFKSFIPAYTKDPDVAFALVGEIDDFIHGSITTATDTYIDILKEQINKREEQLLEAQLIANLGSFEWDLKNNRSTNTPSIYKIFEMEEGTRMEEFMNHIHPLDKKRVEQALARSMKTGYYECDYRYLVNGKEKFIWSKGIMHFEDGKPALLRGTIQDLTNRKKIEEDLLQKTLDLEQSNESLQQFASVASHDLKEPLRKIAMFTDLVISQEMEALSEPSQVNLKRVQNSARRMQQMIEDILSFSSLAKEHDVKPCSLEILLNEVKEILEIAIEEKNAEVRSDGLPEAIVNPSQFRQVFQNLISNSLKFSKPGIRPEISFTHRYLNSGDIEYARLKEGSRYLELCMQDNGIGFEPEYAEQIFGLFHRLHSKSAYEGTGLGLSIARKIITNHGGIITASSAPGEGARFRIILPISS